MNKILYKDLLKKPEYEFIKTQNLSDNFGLLIISGSNSFGTSLEGSDLDIRGFVYEEQKEILLINKTIPTYTDKNTDTVIYKFNHFINMLCKGSITQIEYLGVNDDCIIVRDSVSEYIINNRREFLTREFVKKTYGYILGEINKIEKYKMQLIKYKTEDIINPEKDVILKKLNKSLGHTYRLVFTLDDFNTTGDIITNRGEKTSYLLELRKGEYTKDIDKYGIVSFENSINDMVYNIKNELNDIITKIDNKQIKENVNLKFIHELLFDVNLSIANNQKPYIQVKSS